MRKKIYVLLVAAASFSALSACGRALSDAIGYSQNTPPEVTGFTAVNADGSAIDPKKIAAKRVYLLTVTSSDPDNQKLTYSFRSSYGMFREQTSTATGCTVKFVVGVVKSGDTVDVQALVRDSRGAVTGRRLTLGTGKLGPSISAVADRIAMRSDRDLTVSVSSNCAGNFQLVPCAADEENETAPASIDGSKYMLSYTAGAESSSALVTGPVSSTSGSAQLPISAGGYTDSTFYNIWVVFEDALAQCDAVPLRIRVDDQPPTVAETTPADGQGNMPTQFKLSVKFSEEVESDQLLKEALTLNSAASGSAGSVTFDSYSETDHAAVYSVSGLSKNTSYTATVSGAADLAGNAMADKSFSFMTTPTSSLAYFGNGSTGGSVPAGAQSYDEGAEVTIAGNTGGLYRAGYTFAGWNTQTDGQGIGCAPGAKISMPADDLVLYAVWKETRITGFWLSCGGQSLSGVISGTSIQVTLPMGSSKTGLVAVFTTTGAGAVTVDGEAQTSGVTPNDFTDNRVYRVWSADGLSWVDYTVSVRILSVCTVKFDANGGAFKQGYSVNTQTFTWGVPANLMACPYERTGYSFAGWSVSRSGTVSWPDGAQYTAEAADVTLYAKWSRIPHWVRLNRNDGTGNIDNVTVYEGEVYTPETAALDGYTFAGWYTDSNLTASYSPAAITGDLDLYAKWTYTVTLSPATSYVAFEGTISADGFTRQSDGTYSAVAAKGESVSLPSSAQCKWLVRIDNTYYSVDAGANSVWCDSNGNDVSSSCTGPTAVFYMNTKELAVGDTGPAGGIIFYVNSAYVEDDSTSAGDVWRYMEVWTEDITTLEGSNYSWGSYVGATNRNGIGLGLGNTNGIISGSNGNNEIAAYQARYCNKGGKSDWFLPSTEEAGEMIKTLKTGGTYWTSTQIHRSGLGFKVIGVLYYSSTGNYGSSENASILTTLKTRPVRRF